jgi:hypothetical protein
MYQEFFATDDVGVLLDRTRFTQIRKLRMPVVAAYRSAVRRRFLFVFVAATGPVRTATQTVSSVRIPA